MFFVYPSTRLKKTRKPIAAHFRVGRSGHQLGCANATTKTRARVTPRAAPSVFRLIRSPSNASATPTASGSSNSPQSIGTPQGKVGGAGKTVTHLAKVAEQWHTNQLAVHSLPLAIPSRVASTYGALFTSLQATFSIKSRVFAIYYSDNFIISTTAFSLTFEFPAKGAGNRAVKAHVPRNLLTKQYEQLLTGAPGQKVTLYLFGEFVDKGPNVTRLDLSDQRAIHVEP